MRIESRWGLPSAWAAAIFSPAVSTAAGPLRYCRKAPEGSAPRQRRPTLPVRRLSKPRGRRRSLGGFCGGPCGRQTPAGPSAKTKIRIAQLRFYLVDVPWRRSLSSGILVPVGDPEGVVDRQAAEASAAPGSAVLR